MLSAILIAISFQLMTTTPAVGIVYELYGSDRNFECSDADSDDICILHCDRNTPGSSQFNCGLARDCYFHCEDKQCLKTASLNATSSQNLYAFSSVELCYENANVYTAQHENYFDINQFAQSEFKKLIINGGDSEYIFINCTSTGAESCRQMIINAQHASDLEIVGGSGTIMQDTTIYCPQNNDYNGPNEAPCFLDFSDGIIEKGNFYTLNGIPQDIMIYGELSSTVTIWCDDGVSENVGNSFENTDCWITETPTAYPTVNPTVKPSVNPSSFPTAPPSPTPTANPSLIPTSNPTFNPTLSPTKSPTKTPNTNPTVPPTKTPSTNPILSPTHHPSVTSNPSLSPTKFPTLFPTKYPTLSPTKNPSTKPTFYPSSYPSTSATVKSTAKPTPKSTTKPTPKPSIHPTPSPIYGNEGHVVVRSTETGSVSTETSLETISDQKVTHIWDGVDIKSIIILILLAVICVLISLLCIQKKRRRNTKIRLASSSITDMKANANAEKEEEEWWRHKTSMFDVPQLDAAAKSLSKSIKNVALQLSHPHPPPQLNTNFMNMNVNILPPVNPVSATAVLPIPKAYDFSALSVPNGTRGDIPHHKKQNTNLEMEGVDDDDGNNTNNIAIDIVLPNHLLTPDRNKPLPRDNYDADVAEMDLDEVVDDDDSSSSSDSEGLYGRNRGQTLGGRNDDNDEKMSQVDTW